MGSRWIDYFDGLQELEPDWKAMMLSEAQLLSIPSDQEIFAPEKPAQNMIFLLEGTVRVQQVSEDGREIVLYRIDAGQSCIMTASCLLGHQDYSAQGVSETDLQVILIPRNVFDKVIANSECFRNFVFSTFSMRLTELMMTINEVAFRRLDIRLAKKLLELSRSGKRVETTHQKLGTELGTAREVVSRQLQEFQRREWVEQSRGLIVLKNLRALYKLANND